MANPVIDWQVELAILFSMLLVCSSCSGIQTKPICKTEHTGYVYLTNSSSQPVRVEIKIKSEEPVIFVPPGAYTHTPVTIPAKVQVRIKWPNGEMVVAPEVCQVIVVDVGSK